MPWDSDSLLQQLELGEDSRVEFKEVAFSGNRVRAPRRETIADELAAFGNTIGGTLIFSVSDAGEVRSMNREQMDALEAFVGEICSDSIRPPLAFVTQRLALPDGSFVLVVEVEQSALVHKSPGGYLSRQGSAKREMSSSALNRLFQQRGRSGLLGPDEVIVAGTGSNTLDETLADRFLSSRATESITVQLTKLGLVREDDSRVIRATAAGVLLCTARPDEYIGGATIEAVRYRGTVLGSASQHDAASITGPLDRQVRDAVNFVRLNTRVAARKDPGRVETPQFSPRAVFEAIVNAVVHRDYSIENAKIRLFIFDDRLELYSPGALPNTLPIEAMRNRQATRNETLASILRMLAVGDIAGAGDRQYFLEQRGEGVPIIYEQTRELTGRDPEYELIGGTELRLTVPSARPPVTGIGGEVLVSVVGQPLAGAQVVALYPNKTWMEEETDTFGRVAFGFHSELPITVFCAAPGYAAHVERDWHPPELLSVQLEPLSMGGSAVFTEGTGHLPNLTGRLNPILDDLDRMYLYATNVAIDNGKQQPVHFRLNQPLRLTDVNGFEWIVRFIEMIGESALLEYEPPAHRQGTDEQR
ncbi:MAG: AAA family ATPase [Gemmatimonadetes bacterium]|nr:AAA family ATPase [Gemmatimonadota bacterium]MXY80679.1 AAA family ATPase [Gemmatimonadota bacterium]MYB71014.1 AAA family ATPase [Gemmatimonadota bacterium]